MSALQAGLSSVGRRTDSLGGEVGENGNGQATVQGNRHEILRRIISGYVPLDDTEAGLALVEAVGEQIVTMLGGMLSDLQLTEAQANTLLAASQAACAQMLAVGGATQMAVDGRLA